MTTDFRALCAGYELGDGSMDGAMLVDCEWWHPMFGCDSLQMVVDCARAELAEPAPKGPTDEELRQLRRNHEWPVVDSLLFVIARAVLARWGNSAPLPLAEGEVAELVEWLYEQLHVCLQAPWTPGIKHFGRAANLLERLSPPQPVPVNERLPGPEDCDAEHYCWRWNTIGGLWARQPLARRWYELESHWLPAHALPIPQQQQKNTND